MSPARLPLGKLFSRASHRAANRAAHALASVGSLVRRSEHYGVTVHHDVPYSPTGGRWHHLDVYVPGPPHAARAPFPVVFYVHGGGFAMLSKRTHRLFALAFATRGYLVVNIDYRLGRNHLFPEPLEDAATALLFAHREAERFGGDPARLVLAGESAGANLVTALAVGLAVDRPEPVAQRLRASGIRPSAVIPTYGMLDLTDLERLRRRHALAPYLWSQIVHAGESYVGEPVHLGAARAALASPLRVIEALPSGTELPPFFVSCGTKDPLLDDSRRLAAALARLGVPHELVIHPGEIHGYDAMLWREASKDKWRRTFAFLRHHGVDRSSDALDLEARAASE